ncbi:hypothetical protein BGX29_003103 [Mortierella sp. GBA35]|nr:hypothetical protein BGX29_003103 [Mortierella sp. GBA35]
MFIPTTHISIFEIPLILDLICDHLSRADLLPCLQVSHLWHDLFKPQALRYVRFADLKKHQTWTILDQFLTVDLADAGCFLDNSSSLYINLQTIRCIDFGYVHPDGYDHYDFEEDDNDRKLARHLVDSRTNALNLVQKNARLAVLEVKHARQHYHANHFIPAILLSMSELRYLSHLKVQLDAIVPESFLLALLQYIPVSLENLVFSVKSLHRPEGAPTTPPLVLQKQLSLRRISLGACGVWYEEEASNSDSPAHGLIIPLLQHSPRLVDLVISGDYGQATVLLQTLADYCPLVETINYCGYNSTQSEVVALTGSLLCLREFRFEGYYGAVDEDGRQLVPNFLSRSYSTLEIISIHSDYSVGHYDVNPFRTAAWNFWSECPRLREYSFILEIDYGFITPDHHTIDVLAELLARPTTTCWNLQKLELWVNDDGDWKECARHPKRGGSQATYEHQQKFLWSVCLFYQCLRSFKRLSPYKLDITWDICRSIRKMSLNEVLARINGRTVINRDSDVGAETTPSDEPQVTKKDLTWMGLSWSSSEEKQLKQETKARKSMWNQASYQTRDANNGTPWSRHYRRVGCSWRDWRNLAGLYNCAPEDRVWRLEDNHDCDHVYCVNDAPFDLDDGLDRFLSGHDIKVERGHRRRSMLRRKRKQ